MKGPHRCLTLSRCGYRSSLFTTLPTDQSEVCGVFEDETNITTWGTRWMGQFLQPNSSLTCDFVSRLDGNSWSANSSSRSASFFCACKTGDFSTFFANSNSQNITTLDLVDGVRNSSQGGISQLPSSHGVLAKGPAYDAGHENVSTIACKPDTSTSRATCLTL